MGAPRVASGTSASTSPKHAIPLPIVIAAAVRAETRKLAIATASGTMRMARMTSSIAAYPRSRLRSVVDSDSARE